MSKKDNEPDERGTLSLTDLFCFELWHVWLFSCGYKLEKFHTVKLYNSIKVIFS